MNLYRKYRRSKSTLNLLLALSLLLLVAGCTGMNSDFTCPMTPGHMCASLDEVNTMVDQGVVGGRTVSTHSSNINRGDSSIGVTPYPMSALTAGEPLRYGESVLRIWVAPYEDTAGNYYQPSLMYAVVHPSHWISNPVQATTHDD